MAPLSFSDSRAVTVHAASRGDDSEPIPRWKGARYILEEHEGWGILPQQILENTVCHAGC